MQRLQGVKERLSPWRGDGLEYECLDSPQAGLGETERLDLYAGLGERELVQTSAVSHSIRCCLAQC